MKKIPQDIIGDIAVLKFKKEESAKSKKTKANSFLKNNPSVKTVVEKTGKFSGRLRVQKTKHIAGIKTKTAVYKENGCIFKFDVDKTYFSSRLSNERKVTADDISKLVKKKHSKILVMFSGIAPFPIVIAKKLKQQKKDFHIIAVEINKNANKFAKENIQLNKLSEDITLIQKDVKKFAKNLKEKFDIIVMPRPNLKDTFLKEALHLSKSGTTIFYHGFGTEVDVLKEIKENTQNKIGNIQIRKAGDIAVQKWRFLAKFKVK